MARSIVIEFLGKDKSLGSTAGEVDGKMSKLGGRLKSFGKMAAVGFAAAGAAAVAGGKYFFDVGSKLEQMGMKAETVFGNQLGSVEKWADKNAHAMGLTSREATGLAANFADLLIPMGFTRKQAAGMSTDVVGLSGALSQWSGGTVSAAEASDVLAKAMLGETDGLKALGISISAAEIQARLLKNGQDKLTGAARAQAEAQATQALIMEKSTDAQAAFAAGGSPLLSAQAKLKAAFGEVRDEIAVKLLPVFGKMASWLVDTGLPAAQKLGSELSARFGPIIQAVGGFISGTLVPAVQDLIARFTTAKDGTSKVKQALADAEPFFRLVWSAVKLVGLAIREVLWPILKKVAEVALPAMGAALGAVGKAGTWLWNNALQPVFRFIVNAIGELMIMWGKMLQTLGKVPGFGWAKEAGEKMEAAGGKAMGLAEKIKKIPESKDVKITADTTLAGRTVDAFARSIESRTVTLNVRTSVTGTGLGSRAHGGPVTAGRPYIVGEHEPELFVPHTSGRILNQKQMAAAAPAATSDPQPLRALRADLAAQRADARRASEALQALVQRQVEEAAALRAELRALPKGYALAARQGAR